MLTHVARLLTSTPILARTVREKEGNHSLKYSSMIDWYFNLPLFFLILLRKDTKSESSFASIFLAPVFFPRRPFPFLFRFTKLFQDVSYPSSRPTAPRWGPPYVPVTVTPRARDSILGISPRPRLISISVWVDIP